MKILVVSRFPPDRDGIASYSMQLVMSLRRSGNSVEIVSPYPSAAKYSADFRSNRGLLRILLLSRQSDRTLIEFVSDHFFKSLGGFSFLAHWPFFALLLGLGRNVELVIHEAPHRDLLRESGLKGWVVRAMWRATIRLPKSTFVHTEWERGKLTSSSHLDPKYIELLDHGRDFVRRTNLDRRSARLELGLPHDEFIFLCIGFLQSHKGFDRAVVAFRELPSERIRLDIVGSMRVPSPEIEAYVHQLRMLVATTSRAYLHEGYTTDELFDRWIVAADAVVLPYRDIWSSGVVERAKLYGTALIVSDVGGLPEQAGMFARVTASDEALAAAMASAAGLEVSRSAPTSHSASYIQPVLQEVRLRAAELREHGNQSAMRQNALGDTFVGMPLALRLPFVTGSSPRALLKRLIAALTRWELRPIINRINDLQSRTDARLIRLQREVDDLTRAVERFSAIKEPVAAEDARPSGNGEAVLTPAVPSPHGEVASAALD